jgi:hypothetical protein
MRGARGYPTLVVENVLGVLGIAVFIVCVVSLAMAVTWTVVKVSPSPGKKKQSS